VVRIHRNPQRCLTQSFLSANRGRLDAIGMWRVHPVEGGVSLIWPAPVALSGEGLPIVLHFGIYSDTGPFDPDDNMFGLWSAYLTHHPSMRRWLGRCGPDGVWVTIWRSGAKRAYELRVVAARLREGGLRLSSRKYNPILRQFGPVVTV
jgi:hypothetical protein